MFSDTLTFTDLHGTDDFVLQRINQDGYSSEYRYRDADREIGLTIRNTSYADKKRPVTIDRHTVQLTETVFPVAPATLSTIRKCYAVFENQQGDSITLSVDIAGALCAFLSESNWTKTVNFES
jgi:hypothetical protein